MVEIYLVGWAVTGLTTYILGWAAGRSSGRAEVLEEAFFEESGGDGS